MPAVVLSGASRNDEAASPMFSNGECDREKHKRVMQMSLIRLHMHTVATSPNAVPSA